jgi:hypothetical protein
MIGFDLAQRAFRKGYSLILNRLNDRRPPVARLCAQVASIPNQRKLVRHAGRNC